MPSKSSLVVFTQASSASWSERPRRIFIWLDLTSALLLWNITIYPTKSGDWFFVEERGVFPHLSLTLLNLWHLSITNKPVQVGNEGGPTVQVICGETGTMMHILARLLSAREDTDEAMMRSLEYCPTFLIAEREEIKFKRDQCFSYRKGWNLHSPRRPGSVFCGYHGRWGWMWEGNFIFLRLWKPPWDLTGLTGYRRLRRSFC